MPLWFIALVAYGAGIALLVAIRRTETTRIETPVPIATVFLAIQHHVFALGGVLLALTAGDAMFETRLGWFPVTFGLEQLLWLELVSMAAAFLGVRAVAWVHRRVFVAKRRRAVAISNQRADMQQAGFIFASMLCTGYFASVVGVWLLNTYVPSQWVNYLGVVTQPLVGGFLAAGLGWRFLTPRQRLSITLAGVCLALFGLTQGSRSLWFWPGALWALGFSLVPGRRWQDIARFAVIATALFLPIVIASGLIVPVRTAFVHERHAVTIDERLERLLLLPPLLWEEYRGTADSWWTVRVLAERLVEEPARVVVGVDNPPVGWQVGMGRDLLAGFLPQALFPLQSEEVREPYFLREYGYNVAVGEYVGLGYAFFVDAWRYFGIPGLVGVYIVLGIVLGLLSWKCATYRSPWRQVVFGSLMAYAVASCYTQTLMTFWSRVMHFFLVAMVGLRLTSLIYPKSGVRK